MTEQTLISRLADHILEDLKLCGPETPREIVKRLGRKQSVSEVHSAIDQLIEKDLVTSLSNGYLRYD